MTHTGIVQGLPLQIMLFLHAATEKEQFELVEALQKQAKTCPLMGKVAGVLEAAIEM